MECSEVGRLPAYVESFIVQDVGVMTVAHRHDNGSVVAADCEGREWLFARDYPVWFFAELEAGLELV